MSFGVAENAPEDSSMSFGVAENAMEMRANGLGESRKVLINLEINNNCSYTATCGDRCILNNVRVAAKPISEREILLAAFEFIENGSTIRHFAIPGKEPLESPTLLFDIVERYHNTPREQRPGTIGIITSGLKLSGNTRLFQEFSLDWMILSVDAEKTGLRIYGNSLKALDIALELRGKEKVKRLNVNTVLTRDNIDEVIKIGRSLEERGKVDQWSVGGMLNPNGGSMVHALSVADHARQLDRITAEFGNGRMQVVFVTDHSRLEEVTRKKILEREMDKWRTELRRAPNVMATAANPREGYFMRLRYDGQLLAKADFGKIGLREGRYGRYEPGKISKLMNQFAQLRTEKQAKSKVNS